MTPERRPQTVFGDGFTVGQKLRKSFYSKISGPSLISSYHLTILSCYRVIILSFCRIIILSYYHLIILSPMLSRMLSRMLSGGTDWTSRMLSLHVASSRYRCVPKIASPEARKNLHRKTFRKIF